MPVAIDSQRDYLLEAIASLCRAALDELGQGLVQRIYRDPRNLSTATGFVGALPALSIYRLTQKSRRASSAGRVEDVVVVFDYVMPQTRISPTNESDSADEREKRWPALAAVWSAIEDVVIAGQHKSIVDSEGDLVDVLGKVHGCVQDENSGAVRYGFASQADENHPFFRGQITVEHARAEVDAASLDDFLRHHTGFYSPGADLEEDDPLAEDETNLTPP